MNKAYSRRHWKNYPDDSTPVDEVNLGEGDRAIDIIDDRVIELDATKATKIEVSTMISDVSFDDATGIFTFTRKNGAVITLNTKLEKLAVNFEYDAEHERLVIYLDDGTVQYVDMSALITQYEFVDSDTIVFTLGADGKVTADIKNGSVTEDKMQPNYLADIKVEVGKAQTASANAASSASAAAASETSVADNAQLAQTAATNAGNAQTAAETAQSAAEDAQGAAETAQAAAEDAKADAETAESNAQRYANNANASQMAASTSEQNAQNYAGQAQSFAVGTNGAVRPTDATDNAKTYYEQAKYYYEQALAISQTLSGTLQPKGTITFAQLPGLLDAEAGWMYNISDAFTTDARFKEGAGIPVAAGSNVYKTVDNQWDILAGSPVTQVNGKTGDVTLDKSDVGLGNVPNVTTNNQTPTFTEASTRNNIESGENLTALFGKIRKFFSDLKAVAFSGSYTDLSNRPSIPSKTSELTNDSGFITSDNTKLPLSGGTMTGTIDSQSIVPTSDGGYDFGSSSNRWHYGFFRRLLRIETISRNNYGSTDITIPNKGGTMALTSDIPSVPVTSVAGKTGAVTLSKSDVGLSNVDNIADANKSVNYAASAGNADTTDGYHLNENLTAGDGSWIGAWVNGTLGHILPANLTVGKANYLNTTAGSTRFNWSGQVGQPNWLWGGNDADPYNMYVYNPSNFRVSYANSAGTAGSATTATYATYRAGTSWEIDYDYKNIRRFNNGMYIASSIDTFCDGSSGSLGFFTSDDYKVMEVTNHGTVHVLSRNFETSGKIWCNGTVHAISFHQYSDWRIKKNISDLTEEDVINLINGLNPVAYNLLSEEDGQAKTHGFIAQDAEEVVNKHSIDSNFVRVPQKENELYSLDYNSLIPDIVKYIQILERRVSELEAIVKGGDSN